MKRNYDMRCEDLARHFYPSAEDRAIYELAQRLQTLAEDFDMELAGSLFDLQPTIRKFRETKR